MLISPLTVVDHVDGMNLVAASEDSIEILFLMDHDYGANYHYIRPILESFGWNVTIAGTAAILQPCDYQSATATLESDILIWDVENITKFDAISIMPGESHEILRTDQDVLDLIQETVSEGLIVSAWCKAVRVLAAADVIDGKNVTGSADYDDEYEAAGATYLGIVPPVIDGNIVTGVRSRFYREEMCTAIASALGVLELDPPAISNTIITPILLEPSDTIYISTEVYDATGVTDVFVKFYAYSHDDGNRTSIYPTGVKSLNDVLENGTYSGELSINTRNNYTADIWVRDVFGNEFTYADLEIIEITDIPTTTSTTTSTTSTTSSSSSILETTSSTTTTEPTVSSLQTEILIVSIGAVAAIVVVGLIILKRKG
jgi:putative intracellular protease/amidase